MELWSLYDRNCNKVVAEHDSSIPIPEGLYHFSVEVWTTAATRFFLTKRSSTKKKYRGYWECTGGSALAGEDFLDAAVREVREELGIEVEVNQLQLMAKSVQDKHIVEVFLLDVPESTVFCLSEQEVSEGRWFTVQELESLHLDFNFVPHQFQRYLKHIRAHAYEAYIAEKPIAIQRLLSSHEELWVPHRGLPSPGKRPDEEPFHSDLSQIVAAFAVYGDDLYTKETLLPETVNNSLGSGSPLPCEPFPLAQEAVNRLMQSTELSQYAFPAGAIGYRRSICQYLHREGFSGRITPESIIFAESTTHAFHMILQLILRPGDVILFPAPTYGLFAFEPERLGGESRLLALDEADNWLVSPQKLEIEILKINQELRERYVDRFSYEPRVVGYFQQNPHNPTGKVMTERDAHRIQAICQVCRRNGVFLIDDLLYRDLVFDRTAPTLPAAHFDEEFPNTISLLGVSKAYGLAGLRAGMIVADEVVVRGIRNSIFQTIDSASHLGAAVLAAVFHPSEERYRAYDLYFEVLMKRYRLHLDYVIAAVDGISAVQTEENRSVIRSQVIQCISDESRAFEWLNGIDGAFFVPGTMPESGFFCLLDFTFLKGKKCEDVVIEDDLSLLCFMFSRYRINFITGHSIGWPDPTRIILRISYSASPEKIIRVFDYMKEEIKRLHN